MQLRCTWVAMADACRVTSWACGADCPGWIAVHVLLTDPTDSRRIPQPTSGGQSVPMQSPTVPPAAVTGADVVTGNDSLALLFEAAGPRRGLQGEGLRCLQAANRSPTAELGGSAGSSSAGATPPSLCMEVGARAYTRSGQVGWHRPDSGDFHPSNVKGVLALSAWVTWLAIVCQQLFEIDRSACGNG